MALQTIAVEFRVSGDFDGSTPLSPSFQLDPLLPLPAGVSIDPDTGVYVVEVEGNLGLVDPTFFKGSAYADRFIKWFVFEAEVGAVAASPNVQVVTTDSDGTLVILEDAGDIVPPQSTGLYKKRCTFVPQGGLLRLLQVSGPGVFRMGIWRPESVPDVAAARKACCCREGGVFEGEAGGTPVAVDTNAIQIPAECRRVLESVTPSSVELNEVVSLTIKGQNFETGDNVAFANINGAMSLFNVVVVDDTTITLDLTGGSYAPGPGLFDLTVGPAEQVACIGFAENALVVTVP